MLLNRAARWVGSSGLPQARAPVEAAVGRRQVSAMVFAPCCSLVESTTPSAKFEATIVHISAQPVDLPNGVRHTGMIESVERCPESSVEVPLRQVWAEIAVTNIGAPQPMQAADLNSVHYLLRRNQ